MSAVNACKLSFGERASLSPTVIARQLFELMEEKKSNLALSADVTSSEQLLALADSLGSEICILKTHIDIIRDFSPNLTVALRELANKHHFLLFEDRKFADIGNTVKHQYEGGIYQIADWADIINAHSLPGPGIIKGLAEAGQKKNRGLLLLAQMSSTGHLMNDHYAAQTLQMARVHKDFVCGFITQHALSDEPGWLNMTPGIQMNQGSDTLGQQYNTPERAIFDQGTDIIIVGRGILAANNPKLAAQTYRKAGWNAYLNKIKTVSPRIL